jgi:glycerol-3-phosphate dehydrogenase
MDWNRGWREQGWSRLDQPWDLIIIGGGITGAGILREASLAGLKVVLFDSGDFASGTSSRSSKLVHGGLRYLQNAQLRVTLESVREREYLLKQGRGLVNRLGFLYTCLPTDRMPGWVFGAGLCLYDLMAHTWNHRSYDTEDLRELCPLLSNPGMSGGFRFFDASTDDARLVLRLLHEATQVEHAMALSYARIVGLLRTPAGQVCGVQVQDSSGDVERQVEVHARAVINASGAWADQLRSQVGGRPRLRPLRGSHLVLSSRRLPLTRAVSFLHPRDGRPVMAIPWEGVVIFGTTDVDQGTQIDHDPSISGEEAEYLLEGLQAVFPASQLEAADVQASYSGIRPVVNTGKANPSKESREHVIWDESGLLTASGGKLTTFRIMARDCLQALRRYLGSLPFDPHLPVLSPLPSGPEQLLGECRLSAAQCLRLLGRYGIQGAQAVCAQSAGLDPIPGTPYLWSELHYAAASEGVLHLEDLLLRRVRLGLLLPNGGLDQMDHIRSLVQSDLGWEDARWDLELQSYAELWRRSFHFG